MLRTNRKIVSTRNIVALFAIFGAGVATLGAQTKSESVPATQPIVQPAIDFRVPTVDTSRDALFSSSADENAATPVEMANLHPTVTDFAEAMQYGGGQRKRYGRPRYRGANTNQDGSSKYIFYGGAGLSQPLGNTFHYLTPSYGIQVGGGRQFNKHFAVPIEFDYDHFGFAGETLQNQFSLYNTEIELYDQQDTAGPSDPNYIPLLASLDGSSHVWSFSVDPTYTMSVSDALGVYVVAGAGFYHKVANFTTPVVATEEDLYGDIFQYETNGTVAHYTANAPGFSGGIGVTYKFSRFSNERFYAEARYVFVDNSQRQGVTANTISAATENVPDDYPANSNRTTYLPIKVGIRF